MTRFSFLSGVGRGVAGLGAALLIFGCGTADSAALETQEGSGEHALAVGQHDVTMISYGALDGVCGSQACYQISSARKPEISHIILATPGDCDGHVTAVSFNGVDITSQVLTGTFAQRGCDAITGIKIDRGVSYGTPAIVCLTFDKIYPATGAIDIQLKAGKGCVTGSVPGPTCDATEICDGFDNDCDGTVDGMTRGSSCGVGECAAEGFETCTAGNWGDDTCAPGAAEPEICDGLDNNCDGSADEGTDQPTACGVGACAATGIITCLGGVLQPDTCAPGAPTDEICDNIDNDCDGATDEDLSQPTACGVGACAAAGLEFCLAGAWVGNNCTPGQPGTEVCDNIDNDCDSATDEDLSQPTACGVGACAATGLEFCAAGLWIGNTCTPGQPSGEVCDNVDNDCDGPVDEDLSRPTACGVGACAADGTEYCAAGLWVGNTCVPGAPSGEVCDNIDNDCDGATDEELSQPTECGVGACAADGTEYCEAGLWVGDNCTAGQPGLEVCDNIDNDCDGATDEELSQPTECGVGACAADGTEYCAAGLWGGNTCVPGAPGAEICDNIDNDCDGVVDDGLTQPTSCGLGPCAAEGTEYCAAGLWVGDTCAPGQPGIEVCDNIDNDCDGAIDDGLTQPTACGAGACAADGLEYCEAGNWVGDTCVPGEPGEEVCDGVDNDCDGEVDEGTGGGEQGPTATDTIGTASVTLVSFFWDVAANTTQACYQIISNNPPEVSHYVLGTDAACDANLLSVTIDDVAMSLLPADYNQAEQGCVAIHGLKRDSGIPLYVVTEICVTYEGLWTMGEVSFQAKAGTNCDTAPIDGVVCEPAEVCVP